jgi:hypothetical protein
VKNSLKSDIEVKILSKLSNSSQLETKNQTHNNKVTQIQVEEESA